MKKTAIALFILLCVICGQGVAAAERPNLVIINIDDLGYADIGPFGSTLNRTPHLDRMAAEGRRLTSFYAAPVCSPSRTALMTGCYPKRALPIPQVLFPAAAIGLHPDERTVAELLKEAGYATGLVGKWHLGDQPEFLPTRQGFDFWFGLPYSNDMGPAEDGVKSSFGEKAPETKSSPAVADDGIGQRGAGQPPLPLMRNETVLQRVRADDQTQLLSRYTEEALRFIRDRRDRRFFLYFSPSAVHFPLYPGAKFRGQSKNGLYGDWVEEMDWSVGQLLDALRSLALAEKTLVIFTSDNGGTPRGLNRPLRGHKGSTWEGGMRVPTIAWWPGKIPAGSESGVICGMFDVLPTFVKLAGGDPPSDRKIDGADIWPMLAGDAFARPPHDTFYYYRGLRLEAVRHEEWKLVILPTPQLFNLKTDVGETADVAAQNPGVVGKIQDLVAAMKADLGLDGPAPGSRPLGKATNPRPLIGHDGKVREGFAPRPAP